MYAKPINRLNKVADKGVKRVLFISDLHSGSLVSLLHPKYKVNEGDPSTSYSITLNPIQEFLWKEWKFMCDKIGHVDIVCLVGDMVDGPNKKGEGVGTWTTNMEDQIDNVVKLLKMIDTDRFVGVLGSLYHTKDNLNCDAEVLRRLGSKEWDWDMCLSVDDIKFHVKHTVGTTRSTFMYRPTKIAREMLLLMQNKEKMGEFDFIVRGHVHTEMYLDMLGSTGMAGFTLPCWKARDDFVKRYISDSGDHGWYLFDVKGKRYTRYNRTFHISKELNIREVVV